MKDPEGKRKVRRRGAPETAGLPPARTFDLPGRNGHEEHEGPMDPAALARALRASGLGAWELDPDSESVFLSGELAAILGLDIARRRTATLAQFYARIHEEDREAAAAVIRRAGEEGSPFQFEFRFLHNDGSVRWMEARGQVVDQEPGSTRRICGVGIDITERKASEQHARFLTRLGRATQQLTDPAEMMRVTARMLGEHLNADRCAYAEVESESIFVITGDHARDVPSIVGRWNVDAFGPECARQMLANEPFVVADAETDPRIGPEFIPAYNATTIRGVICVPLHKNGRFTAAMAVHQKVPRVWTDAEIDLVRQVVNGCWESLERMRAERILRESDDRFRLALSSAAVTVYEQDSDLNYKWVYPEAPFRPDVIGKSDEELSPGEDSTLRTELKRKVLETGEPIHTETSATVFGEVKWYDLLIEPRRDEKGNVVGVGGTALDITERRRAEEEVKATAARLNLALAAADLGDWSWDAATDVVTFSERAAEIFGIEPGPKMTWKAMQEMIHEEDRSRAASAVNRSVAEGTRYDVEYRLLRPDGVEVCVAAFGRATYDPSEKATGMYGVVQDITSRRKLQEELAQSEARFRALMEQAPFSIQVFRPDGKHIQVNRAWEELWGSSMEMIPDYNILEDKQLEERGIAADVRRMFGGEAVELPAIRYDPNETIPGGSNNPEPVRWVSAIGYPLKDADGNIKEVALIHQDITERKIAEGILQRYRLLSENARDIIWLLRPDGRLVEVNRAAVETYGYSREELLAMNISQLRADSTVSGLAEQLKKAFNGGAQFVTCHKRRDGTEFPVEVNASGADFGGERLIMGIVRDISERQQAEERLRESEENLRTLANTIPQLAWMAEPDGRVFWYNQRWYEFTGTTSEEMEQFGWERLLDPKVRPSVVERWKASVATGKPIEMEFPLRGADGTYSWFLTRVNPLRDSQGRIVRWFGTNTDITRMREIEDRLRRARNELEERVAARTRDLADANALLMREMDERAEAEAERLRLLKRLFTIQEDERGRIARDIHDQLGQKITALRLKTASIKDLCEDGHPARKRVDMLQEIAEQLDHEAGFVSWQLRPSILDDLKFAEAMKNYVAEWSRHSEIVAEFHTNGLAELTVDHDVEINLYRILQEALNNVAKHSRARSVNVLLERRGEELSLIVEDDGVGLSFNASNGDQDPHQGFGLVGMRERASLINGAVEIESGENDGTVIFVRVPLTARETAETDTRTQC